MKRQLVNERIVEHEDHKEGLENLVEVERDRVRVEQVLVEVGLVLLEGVQTHLEAVNSLLGRWVRGLRGVLGKLRLKDRDLRLDVLRVLLAVGSDLVHERFQIFELVLHVLVVVDDAVENG